MLWIHTEENRGLLEFYSSDNFLGEKMLVVIPFANDIEMVEKNIARWHHYEASSTKFPVNRYVDLLFYYHRDLQDVREIKERVDGLVKSVKSLKYFNNVFVLSAHLNQWEDSYPLGPSKMFFKLTLETPLIQDMGYGGMFWMEPDCWPIRNCWLERLYKEGTASGPYWMIGSLKRDGKEYEKQFENITDHINGNALYKIGDPNFIRYLELVSDDFDQRMSKYLRSFDVALYVYRMLLPYSQRSRFEHYFRYSPTVMNVYRTETRIFNIQKEQPEVFLHGRHLVE